MKVDNLFANGSRWFKADLHLHTKADKEFILPQDYNEHDFTRDYIVRLKAAGIGIGIITNHNKFDSDEFRDIRKASKKEGIYLLAGVELSINDGQNGIHALIVFDDCNWIDETNNYIDQFLTAAFEGIHNRENANTRCNYSIDTLLERLDDHRQSGRDAFIIMAHIEEANGFLKELNGGRIGQLAQNALFRQTVIGFQKLRTYTNISKLENWYAGHPLPAFVEGSDCKSIDDVGKMGTQKDENGAVQEKACYLKIGDFNFEAVKYALKDKGFRTIDKQIPLTNGYIKSISFVGGRYDGQTICLSREMNNIIGIRGSGKSAILEVMRDGLGINYGAKVADDLYKKGLIEYTLGSGGKVIVEIEAQGHNYRYEKIYDQSPALYQDGLLINTVSIDTVINKPLYFGQKDLSNSGMDFEADLVRRLTGSRRGEIESKIEQKKRDIITIISELRKISNIEQQKEQSNNRRRDIEHTLSVFREKGLEEKLRKEARFSEDEVRLNGLFEKLAEFSSAINGIIDEYDLFFSTTKLESSENQDLFDKAKEVLSHYQQEYSRLKTIKENTRKYQTDFQAIVREVRQRREQLKEEFASIRREIKIPQINPDDFSRLSAELKTIELKLKEIERADQRRKQLESKLKTSLTELATLWHEEYTFMKDEIERFNNRSEHLKIEITYQGRKDRFKENLKQQFRGTRIQDNKYDEIAEKYPNYIEILNKSDDIRSILSDASYAGFIERFKEKLHEFLTFRVEDKFTLKYHGRPLSEHSLGQRASALILFLLAQKDSSLIIIDQPEDDLDNQTIYQDVIKVLRQLKGKIQFIFATHNANIPVLGDSEQIIACSYQGESFLEEHGSIDNPDMQQNIVAIMEGGEEAFARRKDIYESWKL